MQEIVEIILKEESDARKKIEQAQEEAEDILMSARQEAKKAGEEILKSARETAAEKLSTAQDKCKSDREEILEKTKNEAIAWRTEHDKKADELVQKVFREIITIKQ